MRARAPGLEHVTDMSLSPEGAANPTPAGVLGQERTLSCAFHPLEWRQLRWESFPLENSMARNLALQNKGTCVFFRVSSCPISQELAAERPKCPFPLFIYIQAVMGEKTTYPQTVHLWSGLNPKEINCAFAFFSTPHLLMQPWLSQRFACLQWVLPAILLSSDCSLKSTQREQTSRRENCGVCCKGSNPICQVSLCFHGPISLAGDGKCTAFTQRGLQSL